MCLHSKYKSCNSISLGVRGKYSIFMLSLCRQDKQTDRQATVKQYAPNLSCVDIKTRDFLIIKKTRINCKQNGSCLTLYHTVQTFDDPERGSFKGKKKTHQNIVG